MKCIILAAGYGNRMRPLTDLTHKTLLKIGDHSIIERIIDGLSDNSIHEIIIVTGYRAEELKVYLNNKYPEKRFTFVHNGRYRETNNIYSLALAFEKVPIDDDIILIESDLIYEPSVIERLLKSKYENIALLDKWRMGMDGTVVTVNNSLITQVIPTHLQGPSFDFSDKYKTLNIYKFSKEFCNTFFKKLLSYYSRSFNDNCYYELILGVLIYMQEVKIYAEILNGERWTEVDDPNDLRVAEFIFNRDRCLEILEDTFGGYWSHDVLDFSFIRNMYFPTASMLSEMRNNLSSLLQNYGSKQSVLNQKLAYFLLYKKEFLNVLNGASQIYPILKNYFHGKKILLPMPTFGEYPRIFPIHDTYSDKVGVNIDELTDKIRLTDLIVVVNPNNPTGSVIDSEQLFELIRLFPEKTFIFDESFVEFSGTKSIITLLEDEPSDNVIVIKSLSKSIGLPGIRLGFVYSNNKIFNKVLSSEIPIWNLNSMAEFLLEIVLKHRKSLDLSYMDTIRDREQFSVLLSKLDFVDKVYPSGGNFILLSLTSQIRSVKNIVNLLLKDYSIYIKDVSGKFNNGKNYLRLAVRLPHENTILVQCLNSTLKKLIVQND
jgi:histidinol-phosphate/aromatic aminotransferase/cobyric acid decarboxylase-like protein/choline kinase